MAVWYRVQTRAIWVQAGLPSLEKEEDELLTKSRGIRSRRNRRTSRRSIRSSRRRSTTITC
jgi:hypothetical protein